MKKKILALATAGAATAMLMVAPAGAGRKPDQDACKNGGYAQWTSAPGGAAFKNQGLCMAFVRSGGTLVPVNGEL